MRCLKARLKYARRLHEGEDEGEDEKPRRAAASGVALGAAATGGARTLGRRQSTARWPPLATAAARPVTPSPLVASRPGSSGGEPSSSHKSSMARPQTPSRLAAAAAPRRAGRSMLFKTARASSSAAERASMRSSGTGRWSLDSDGGARAGRSGGGAAASLPVPVFVLFATAGGVIARHIRAEHERFRAQRVLIDRAGDVRLLRDAHAIVNNGEYGARAARLRRAASARGEEAPVVGASPVGGALPTTPAASVPRQCSPAAGHVCSTRIHVLNQELGTKQVRRPNPKFLGPSDAGGGRRLTRKVIRIDGSDESSNTTTSDAADDERRTCLTAGTTGKSLAAAARAPPPSPSPRPKRLAPSSSLAATPEEDL